MLKERLLNKKTIIAVAVAAALLVGGVSVYASTDKGKTTTATLVESYVTMDEAQKTALAKVNGAAAKHVVKSVEDQEDGKTIYEFTIKYDGYKYEIDVDATDGTIISYEKEKIKTSTTNNKNNSSSSASSNTGNSTSSATASGNSGNSGTASKSNTSNTSNGISAEKAKSIALAQVSGATSGNITDFELDYDDGKYEYSVEIKYNGYEYDFEIDKATGKILEKDVERLDYDD